MRAPPTPKIKFHIIDQEMDEVLLERPLLRSLGFDLDDHLANVRDIFDGQDMATLTGSDVDTDENDGFADRLSALSPYEGLWYNTLEDDSIKPPLSVGAKIGSYTEREILNAFLEMIKKAKDHGISHRGQDELRKLLKEFRDIFKIKLGADPPANVNSMRIQLKENHRPYRSTQRRYAKPQQDLIIKTNKKLEEVGAVYSNSNSKWASPAHAVHKHWPEQFRFTADLRGPNPETIPVASAMHDAENLAQSIFGRNVFAKIDTCHAYWQIPLHPNSQECMSIRTQ